MSRRKITITFTEKELWELADAIGEVAVNNCKAYAYPAAGDPDKARFASRLYLKLIRADVASRKGAKK